jgi:hypothetical protein
MDAIDGKQKDWREIFEKVRSGEIDLEEFLELVK